MHLLVLKRYISLYCRKTNLFVGHYWSIDTSLCCWNQKDNSFGRKCNGLMVNRHILLEHIHWLMEGYVSRVYERTCPFINRWIYLLGIINDYCCKGTLLNKYQTLELSTLLSSPKIMFYFCSKFFQEQLRGSGVLQIFCLDVRSYCTLGVVIINCKTIVWRKLLP